MHAMIKEIFPIHVYQIILQVCKGGVHVCACVRVRCLCACVCVCVCVYGDAVCLWRQGGVLSLMDLLLKFEQF